MVLKNGIENATGKDCLPLPMNEWKRKRLASNRASTSRSVSGVPQKGKHRVHRKTLYSTRGSRSPTVRSGNQQDQTLCNYAILLMIPVTLTQVMWEMCFKDPWTRCHIWPVWGIRQQKTRTQKTGLRCREQTKYSGIILLLYLPKCKKRKQHLEWNVRHVISINVCAQCFSPVFVSCFYLSKFTSKGEGFHRASVHRSLLCRAFRD